MNFVRELSLGQGFSLVVPDTTFTIPLIDAVEKNRTYLAPYVDWVHSIKTKKDAQYFLERNVRGYRELIGGLVDASHHNGFSFFMHKDGKCLGMTGFQGISLKNQICALGYWIDHDLQGMGIMTKANALVVDYAFEVVQCNRVEIQCAVTNESSVKMAKRLGFIEEARLRQVQKTNEGYLDHYLFSKLRSEHEQS